MSKRPLAQGREFSFHYRVKDSVSVRGDIDSRIDQQQQAGSILAVLRGLQELGCTGGFRLTAEQGVTQYSGRVTAFFAPEVRKAKNIVNDARGLLKKFASMHPESRVEITVSLEINSFK